MSNVAGMAAAMAKRAGKQECFDIIRKATPGEALTEDKLAVLYSYFLPPKPKKVTSVFEWAAYACDDKARFSFCQFVESKGGNLIAANTRAAHIVFGVDMAEGFYDTGKGFAGVDITVMPDCMGAMTESMSYGPVDSFDISSMEVRDTPSGLVYVMPWSGKTVHKNYLDVVAGSMLGVTCFRSESGPFSLFGFVGGHQVCAVIMPSERAGV